jgi:hypothetical protein
MMAAANERGSALVITLMLLLILTAIGIYAVSISTTEMGIALNSRVGIATLNSAESGANFGIDKVPNVYTTAYVDNLADLSSYSMTSGATGAMTLKSGFGSNYRFADFQVTSQGRAPTQFVATRAVQVVVNYGPGPVGTMY